jgi:hypothetical protein
MSFEVPVLLIVWRRPDVLCRVIDALRQVAPSRVFVACDGPSQDRVGESEKVSETRRVIEEQIDWPCQVHHLYSETNQGCRDGVSRAISWFFGHVEEGIILEDDCVPHPSFFCYCSELLERYRHDSRIMSICGSNFQEGRIRGKASYYFSIHGDSWGWATWRRSWALYESAQDNWLSFRDEGRLEDVFPIRAERAYWREILDRLFIEGTRNTWDYQWWLACWMNNGLHAWPNVNLVSNEGFNSDGTHTLYPSSFASVSAADIGIIVHPSFVLPSRSADSYAFWRRRSGVRYVMRLGFGPLYLLIASVWRALRRR